jgi:hypothetical protein
MPLEMHRRVVTGLLAGTSAVLALGAGASPLPTVTLGVEGRSNATPGVASDGPNVAVVWGATMDGKTDVFVAVSRDSGASFGKAVQVNRLAGEARLGGELPPRVALMPAPGSSSPEMVVLWTARGDATAIRTARSRDGGRTFEPPVTLQASAAPGDRGWPSLALDSHGTAHAIWLDHRGLAAGRVPGAPRAKHAPGAAHDGAAMAQKSGVYYATAGETASTERELAPGVCYCCKTALAIGPDGSVYAAWRHVYPGNFRDMAFTSSRDGGRTFAPPVRVSEDGWAINGCPDDGPALAVDRSGAVHLVWPTVIDGPNPEGALFYATTRDGRTFTARARIPSSGAGRPSHPQIVVDGRGRVVVAWDESVDGQRVALAREVKGQRGVAVETGPIITLSSDGPALYPVLAATPSGLVAVWATGGPSPAIRARVIPLP